MRGLAPALLLVAYANGGIKMIAGVFSSLVAVLAACWIAPLSAQGYPTRPITMIVPFAAGGPADGLSRTVAGAMGKHLKQTIVIENVGGASGNIGVARGAKATPDGYTILYNNIAMATAPLLYRNLDFNPLNDFEYISLIGASPNVLIARGDFPATTFKELLAYVKANQDKLTIADSGPGGPSNLCALLFMAATGTRLTSVPYKGTAPAMNDLLGKQVDLLCDAAATATPQIKAGRVKAFGITGRSRLAYLPDLPTLDEQGLRGFEMMVWNALYAPKKTPQPVIDRLVSALQASLSDPNLLAYLDKAGSQAVSREQATPAVLQAHLKAEIDKWGPLIKKAGIVAN